MKGKGNPCNKPRRTHRVSGGIAQLFLNHSTRRGCVVSITPRKPLPRKRPGTLCTGGWVGPGAGLDRFGKSCLTGVRSPDLPARSESLYGLHYPGSNKHYRKGVINTNYGCAYNSLRSLNEKRMRSYKQAANYNISGRNKVY
jgi:hypothetical protein